MMYTACLVGWGVSGGVVVRVRVRVCWAHSLASATPVMVHAPCSMLLEQASEVARASNQVARASPIPDTCSAAVAAAQTPKP
jgi:hypothetical protein